jgi:hypothetical protein
MADRPDDDDPLWDARACARLWTAVLSMALIDIDKPSKWGHDRLPLGWWYSDDCREVCEYAGVDYTQVVKRVRVMYRDRRGA